MFSPFWPGHVIWLAELYRVEGRLDEAEAEALKAIEMHPRAAAAAFWVLGLVYQDQGRHEKAIEVIHKAADFNPGLKWALGLAYAKAGRLDEARNLLNELNSMETNPWTAVWRVLLNGALGNIDEAFHWAAYEPHHHWIAWSRVWDPFEPLWDDPRFPDLIRRMNLPPR